MSRYSHDLFLTRANLEVPSPFQKRLFNTKAPAMLGIRPLDLNSFPSLPLFPPLGLFLPTGIYLVELGRRFHTCHLIHSWIVNLLILPLQPLPLSIPCPLNPSPPIAWSVLLAFFTHDSIFEEMGRYILGTASVRERGLWAQLEA